MAIPTSTRGPTAWRSRARRYSMAAGLRRTVAAIGVVLTLLSLSVTSVLAAPPSTDSWSFSRQGYSAEAWTSECTESDGIVTCTGTSVYVFSGKTRDMGAGAVRGSEVCVSYFTDVFNEVTHEGISYTVEFGCTTDVGAGTIIDRELGSATITPTTITLQSETCDQTGCTPGEETRDVVVEGTFTAVSPEVRQRYRSFYDDGVCTFRDSFRGVARVSTFVGTLDGQTIEVSGEDFDSYSQIGYGSSSYAGRCVIEG
jgi:hypothetical protein